MKVRKQVSRASYPKVVSPIDVPLDKVPVVFRKVRLEPVLIADVVPLFIAGFLMLLVMAVLWVDLVGTICSKQRVQAYLLCSYCLPPRNRLAGQIQLTRLANFPS